MDYNLAINDEKDLIWGSVKEYILKRANYIEFNVLYKGKELDEFVSKYFDSLVDQGKKKDKLFRSGEYLRFSFTEDLQNLIKTSRFSYFQNKCIEDPSFYVDDDEVVATITHENQIYIKKGIKLLLRKSSGLGPSPSMSFALALASPSIFALARAFRSCPASIPSHSVFGLLAIDYL